MKMLLAVTVPTAGHLTNISLAAGERIPWRAPGGWWLQAIIARIGGPGV
jgi:hypothetical protein